MANNVVLGMKNIEKRFSNVYALKGVNLILERGEVHALLGENGAGKSTLIKVLGGIYHCDGGEIYIDGIKTNIENVRDAQAKGISIIHQEIVLVPHLSVAQNIFLGREPVTKTGIIDIATMKHHAQEMVLQLGLNIDVTQDVFRLTIAQQQLVEIVKAVSFDAKIIVMDEPTSSLTEHEVKQLFKIIHSLRAKGIGMIYISHKLGELFEISDKITVMRDGTYVGTLITKDTNKNELISMMVGRSLTEFYTRTNRELGDMAIETVGLTKRGQFEGVAFSVKQGEIVGFAGLVGAGRSEVMKAVFGIDTLDAGTVLLEGKPVQIRNVRDAMSHKIALIPEDRKKEGLVLKGAVGFNMTLTVLKEFIAAGRVNYRKKMEIIRKYIDSFSIKTPSPEQLAMNLSGGNQQKIVLAKWLATKPKVLILDEPTRGVDVGAKAEIYAIIDQLAQEGLAVIMISSELPEIINMCDRVYVMARGKIQGELARDDFSQEKIMEYATGGE